MRSQVKEVINEIHCAAGGPRAWISALVHNIGTNVCPLCCKPNSAGCFTAPVLSPPPLASATTLAPDALAASRYVLKSPAFKGCPIDPSTLPPALRTASEASASSAAPKA